MAQAEHAVAGSDHATQPTSNASTGESACTIERQFDLFAQLAETLPEHVDGHQHVEQFPVIRDTLIRRYPAAQRLWLRVFHVTVALGYQS